MEKINRFLAKHCLVLNVIACVLIMVLYCITVEEMGILAFGLLLLASNYIPVWMYRRSDALLKKPAQILDNTCDPYPYLEELQRQRTYSGAWTHKYNRMMLEAGALCIVGRPVEAYRLLSPLQERLMRSRFMHLQLVYCGSMVSVCRALERGHEVEVWHAKYMERFYKVKNKRMKARIEAIQPMYMARYHTFRREHTQAMTILQQIYPKKLYDQVAVAMLCAKNYLPMGETDKAKEALRFVAEKGNRLHIAEIARKMLAEMD